MRQLRAAPTERPTPELSLARLEGHDGLWFGIRVDLVLAERLPPWRGRRVDVGRAALLRRRLGRPTDAE
jgi:hypothetical protein